ncbi:hypothetical protein NDU88_005980 [Pleurodeles waltl]|uniref:Secreted protein n=1 Tax=Pleurodeles waltl TaxID=8319 RepID=A0AAV7X2A7_PLEWA|nr:hypothetical protein NDU88_005980 [Pleurodeles waltl]
MKAGSLLGVLVPYCMGLPVRAPLRSHPRPPARAENCNEITPAAVPKCPTASGKKGRVTDVTAGQMSLSTLDAG